MKTENLKDQFIALTDAEIRNIAPMVFSDTKSPDLSEHYHQFPTYKVMRDVMKQGWIPVAAEQVKVRKAKNEAIGKHKITFRNPDIVIENEDDTLIPELHLTNSHDGKSKFEFHLGVFRLVCSNGLVISDERFDAINNSLSIRHMGYNFQVCKDTVDKALEAFEYVTKDINDMMAFTPETDEQYNEIVAELTKAACEIRWPGMNDEESLIDPVQMNEYHRSEDKGRNMWLTFNRIQEAMINPKDLYDIHDRKVRSVKNINQKIEANKSLWTKAMELVAI